MTDQKVVFQFKDQLKGELDLSYEEKQLLEEGAYREIAAQRLNDLQRQIWYDKLLAVAGGVCLFVVTVTASWLFLETGLAGASFVGTGGAIFLVLMSTAGYFRLWTLGRRERKRLLYELVAE